MSRQWKRSELRKSDDKQCTTQSTIWQKNYNKRKSISNKTLICLSSKRGQLLFTNRCDLFWLVKETFNQSNTFCNAKRSNCSVFIDPSHCRCVCHPLLYRPTTTIGGGRFCGSVKIAVVATVVSIFIRVRRRTTVRGHEVID